jgi:hypothetical protein
MKMTALLVTLLALALPAARADAQTTLTKTQAYKHARHCLLASGKVRFVGRRGDGGGYTFFKRYKHVVYWRYKTLLGQVESVTVYEFRLPAGLRKVFRRCVRVA